MNKNEYYPQIDTLRAFAALLVLGYHFTALSQWSENWLPKIFPIFHIGWIGVDLFLILSGFVITRAALFGGKLQTYNEKKRYILRRLIRIVPLYLLTCSFWLIFIDESFVHLSIKDIGFHVITHLTFLHNLFYNATGSINGVNWSVALEMQFYVFLFILILKINPKKPFLLLSFLLLFTWLYRFVIVQITPYSPDKIMEISWLITQLPGMLDEFGLGIALALLAFYEPKKIIFKENWYAFLIYFCLFVFLLYVAFEIFLKNSIFWNNKPMLIFWRTLIGLSFTSLLLAFLAIPQILQKFLIPFNYLGKISYGIYLWHMAILILLQKYTELQENSLLIMLLMLTVIVSALSWHFFEKPVMNLFSRKFNSNNP